MPDFSKQKALFFLSLIWLVSFNVAAQTLPYPDSIVNYEEEDYGQTDPYEEEEVGYIYVPPPDETSLVPLSPDLHRELIEEFDYNDDKKDKEAEEERLKQQEERDNWLEKFFDGISFGSIELGPITSLILILLLAGGLGYFIFRFLDVPTTYRSKAERDAARVDVSELEDEKLTLTETESLLQRAEKNEQFELAVRLQFLALLKRLHEEDYIKFAKDKINRAYLREMEEYPELSAGFRKLTHNFERNWYGQYPIDPFTYRLIADTYRDYNRQLDVHRQANTTDA
ncbi:hypothetical protein CEQ90_13000 [Lewinellaceae bacterium SD302]|nr:hypothetical protein CEQ90_13000 [Lewinellaceae bacterium SD302]